MSRKYKDFVVVWVLSFKEIPFNRKSHHERVFI